MDIWKYYDITHKKHVLLNPMSMAKFEGLLSLLNLNENCKVLDIGCGKGGLLTRLAELFNISGIGVDISPYFIKDCIDRKSERIPDSDIKFLEMDGAGYLPEKNELFDLAICLGASFVYKGFSGTIDALKKMTGPGGLIIIGEPYWLKEPDKKYLKMSEIKKEDFNSHIKNIEAGEKAGLVCLYTLVSSLDDWDHYETLQWWSAYDYISTHPDDPDNPELLNSINKAKMEYLLYGRETLGWAIYVFKLKI
ncbi:MAG: class I SAM-dependent methyltransferase [Actinobacteria bacterium]|nr:class I SAM-dependent methyltransferase [Actinomycetota bacterium]MBM3713276.1 class I SAM-dependent methyltransferase [Actinomycetota bacterium]